jgi:hypothetical protein
VLASQEGVCAVELVEFVGQKMQKVLVVAVSMIVDLLRVFTVGCNANVKIQSAVTAVV